LIGRTYKIGTVFDPSAIEFKFQDNDFFRDQPGPKLKVAVSLKLLEGQALL
jgi:hypothetical protein